MEQIDKTPAQEVYELYSTRNDADLIEVANEGDITLFTGWTATEQAEVAKKILEERNPEHKKAA